MTVSFVIKKLFDAIAQRQQLTKPLPEIAPFPGLADTLPVPIWIAEDEGRCSWCNSASQEITGRSLWIEALHPEDRSFCIQKYSYALKNRQKFQIVHRLVNTNGQVKWIESTGMPQITPQGKFIYIICGVVIAKQKETKICEIKDSETKQLEDFIAAIDYQLQEPITNIKVAIELLSQVLNKYNSLTGAERESKILTYFKILRYECEREISAVKNFTSSSVLKEMLTNRFN